MKTVLAIAVLFLLATAFALASASNWMLYIQTDSPDGQNYGTNPSFGIKPAGIDGLNTVEDGIPQDRSQGTSDLKWAGNVLAGDIYSKNFMSSASYTTYPNQQKVWDFRVAGMAGAAGDIRFQFKTSTSTILRVPAADSVMKYYIKLVNNRGKAIVRPTWAPDPGAPWVPDTMIELTIPTLTNALFGGMILPLQTSTFSNVDMLAQGYDFQFIQGAGGGPVPEPGSLLVLGTGILGLVGFAARRRK